MNHFSKLFFTFLALGTLLLSCQDEAAVEDSQSLTLLAPQTVSSIPLLELAESRENLNVELFTDHAQALGRFLQGEVDLLFTGFPLGYQRHIKTQDAVLLANLVWEVSSILTKESAPSIAELPQGPIYAPFEGSPIDLQLKKSLELMGEEREILYAPFPQQIPLLMQGQAAAIVLPEPLASKLVLGGQALRLETLGQNWSTITGGESRSPQVSLYGKPADLESSKETWSALMDDLDHILKQQDQLIPQWSEKYAQTFSQTPDVMAEALAKTDLALLTPAKERALIESYIPLLLGGENPGEDFYFRK